MDFETRLISMYVFVTDAYKDSLWIHSERMSNNTIPKFSDEEVITIYLFGILEGHYQVSKMYKHTKSYLNKYFPDLPSYQAFNKRLNNLASTFPYLFEYLDKRKSPQNLGYIGLLDSMPIVLAKGVRGCKAKVASEIANCSYCASKKMYYYGVKLHVIGEKVKKSLPYFRYTEITPASEHDSLLLKRMNHINFENLFADRAYTGHELYSTVKVNTDTKLITPIKKKKGQLRLNSRDRMYSTAVSKIRQPIESLFNWIQEKTNIQNASKVRSLKGLNVHIWGKLTVAMWIMIF